MFVGLEFEQDVKCDFREIKTKQRES